MKRLVKPLLFMVIALAAVVAFVTAGRWSTTPIDLSDVSGWLSAADPVDALAELARLLGIVLAAYVALVAGVALVAELADLLRLPRLTRALRRLAHVVAVPALRKRLLEAVAVVTVTASSLQTIPAGAAPLPRATVTVMSATTTPAASPATTPAVGLGGEFAGFDLPSTVHLSPNAIGDRYVAQPGDTLWSIIEQRYGTANQRLLDTVVTANPEIDNPDLILAGWTLLLPSVPSPASIEDSSPIIDLPAATVEVAPGEVVVAPGDTLWSIIAREYRHATAELVRATVAANPDITDPNLIFPGQRIVLPAQALHPDAPVDSGAAPAASPPTEAGETPPPSQAAAPPPTTDAAATPSSSSPSPPPSTTVDVATPPTPTTPETTTSSSIYELPAGTTDIKADAGVEATTPAIASIVGWTGGGALAAGLLVLARRRRRRQPIAVRHARRSRSAIDVGVALQESENVAGAERAALALRHLGSRVSSRRGESTPVPRLLRISGDGIELVWDTPNPSIVEPWHSSDGGWSWNLDANAPLDPTDAPAPCPAFVTVGKRGGADVLLNLEGCGVLAISGDGATTVARSIASELACSVFADAPTVLVVGDITLVGEPDHARHVEPGEAAGWLRDRSESASALLASRRLTSLFALRARSKPLDAHEPVIVIVDTDQLDDPTVEELTDLAHGDLGAIVVLVGGPARSEWQLAVEADEAHLAPLGLDLDPVAVTDDFTVDVDTFMPDRDPDLDESVDDAWGDDDLDEGAYALSDHLDVLHVHSRAHDVGATLDSKELPATDKGWDVELKILGQVRAVGSKERLTPTELHLAIYLAFNRSGQNADTIATMLWPNGISTRTLTNAMASLRRKLGTGSDGEPLFPLGRDRQYTYRLSDRVVTDWDRFIVLVSSADQLDDERQAAERLNQALALVDGPPFRAATGYSWAYSDGSAMLITDTVEAAARRAAQLHESCGNDAGVAQARYRVRRIRGVDDDDEIDGEQIELPWRDVTSP